MAVVTCQWCKNKDEKHLMQKESKGFYHIENCISAYLMDKEYKRIEREKQTQLAEKIADVHGLDSIQLIPRQIYPLIEDIRNDSTLFGKLKKQYKKGIPYEAIAFTYEYCREKVQWAKANKDFKNTFFELKYCLAIVRNNLADAKEHAAKTSKQKESTVKLIENLENMAVVNDKIKDTQTKSMKQNKTDELDIASLFD